MFNLIPDTLKNRILKDYKERRVIVLLFGFMCLMCILFFFISPSFGFLYFEEKNVVAEAEVMKRSDKFKKADQVVTTIRETNEQLKVLSSEVSLKSPIEAIGKATGAKNSSIYITNIQYKEVNATSSTLMLQGKAGKRDGLKQFVTNLQNISGFSDVTVPVSNFAKEKDIDFTINIKIL